MNFSQLANSAAGYVVSLASDSISAGGSPSVVGPDGSAVPYGIRFGGKNITFANGEANLASVTRHSGDGESSGEFEIVSPLSPGPANQGYTDHLTLIVTAR